MSFLLVWDTIIKSHLVNRNLSTENYTLKTGNKFLLGFTFMPERQYWWAGLSRTQKESIEGEFLWSPFKNKMGQVTIFMTTWLEPMQMI